MEISPTRRAVSAAVIVLVLNGLLYLPPVYLLVGADSVLLINTLVNIATALLGVLLAFKLWRSFQRGEALGTVWGCLLAGLVLWTVAEIVWDAYQLLSETKSSIASPADLAWILGYVAFIAGLALRIRTLKMRPRKAWQFAVLAAVSLLIMVVVIYVIVPILNDTGGLPSYDKWIILAYLAGDMLLAFLALLLVLVLEGGLLSRSWAVIALACFCVAISDVLYVFAVSHGIYQPNPAAGLDLLSWTVDMTYTFAYVLMALGLYMEARLLEVV